MSALPTGTVTFFFSDIEGSTKLIQELGDAYPEALLAHHTIQRETLKAHHGHELRTEGDSFFIVFGSALDACAGAAAVQQAMTAHQWPRQATVRIRIGLHTGEAALVGNEYLGLEVHRAARIASAAHGGQVLLSETTRVLVEHALAAELSIRDLGTHRLKDLARAERLYQLSVDGLAAQFPPLRTLEATPNNLPTQLTSFIGRDDQVRDAKALLARARLLTLTGPGGTGKTRLSLQIAAEVLHQFPDGVFFVPLAAVQDPELVPSAIAQALALQSTGSRRPIDALLEYLKDKRMLLVLDNFEQLIPAAPVTTTLLENSSQLRIVVSSRAVLRVYGEQEFPVPPLALPSSSAVASVSSVSQFEAVRLFIERAVAAKPDFQATNENAPAIAGICERVDGLPLAIELAAARIKLFSPQALLLRLDKSLTALGTGARDLPTRQQTLRGAIQWSYDLLEEPSRRLFERFAVFARGASLEQAEAVCADNAPSPRPRGEGQGEGPDVLEGLDQLADQSLLRRVPEVSEPRFLMLQTIREFAMEKLQARGDGNATRDRHVQAFLALARQAQPYFLGDRRKEWFDRLGVEQDNFRAALDWTIESGDACNAMELASLLWRYWQVRGHIWEGRARMTAVLALPRALEFPKQRLAALEAAGSLAYWQADMETASRYYDECLELTRTIDDKKALAHALYNAAFPLFVDRERPAGMARARVLLEEALPLFRELGEPSSAAGALWALGNGYYFEGDFKRALELLAEARATAEAAGNRFTLAWALHTTGLSELKLGNHDAARASFLRAIGLFREDNDVSGLVLQLDNLSQIIRLDGNAYLATRLASAAKAHQGKTGTNLGQLLSEQEGRTGREGLDEATAARAWAEGENLPLDQAIDDAIAAARNPEPVRGS